MKKEKCCNTCKKSMFGRCNILKTNEEYQKLFKNKKSIFDEDVYNFKNNFICEEYKSMYIEYPIEVSKINSDTEMFTLDKDKVGKFVKIRPCADEYDNKTFLGLYLVAITTRPADASPYSATCWSLETAAARSTTALDASPRRRRICSLPTVIIPCAP